ncbi:MAG: type II toxin-antitoxin system prevent-host-death family antitoxin [Propionibacteriaceae bacterium]|jgi:prevent-host-death family protein|nr:type II toxin-antitoxin system prevent-host-death family antitoxin [Propionibacteriaceae bacterium]
MDISNAATFSTSDAKHLLGQLITKSQTEDVLVTHHGKPMAIIVSTQKYEKVFPHLELDAVFPLTDAKHYFSRVVKMSATHDVLVTFHGKPVSVIVSQPKYEDIMNCIRELENQDELVLPPYEE